MESKKAHVKDGIELLTESKLVNASVYLMLLSYFYNLPVMTYSAKGNNELRLYDFAGALLLYLYFSNFSLISAIINSQKTLRTIYQFLLWASFTYLFTVFFSIINFKLFWAIQSLLYLYHFWAFFLAAVFLVIVIQDLKRLTKIVTVTLALACFVFLIVVLQNFGILPFLWNASYASNYFGFLSGTLGPNKIVLGMTCLFMFAFSLGLLNDKRVKINTPLLLITLGLSALVLIMSGSRTSYVGLLVFVVYFFIRETKNFAYSVIVLSILMFFVSTLNPKLLDKATDVYQGRVENKIRNPSELREGKVNELYEDLGSGRKELSLKYLDLLYDNLLFVPFGKGFNNRLDTFSSAHNIYLSLVFEVGIVGVFLYFRWLSSFLFLKMQHFSQLRMALKGLVVAMLVTLLFGEHLYIYRPLFGLLGLFLFITTLLSSPIFILKHEQK